jgi:hypothetical protein
MSGVQSCELDARLSALLSNGLGLLALLGYHGYITYDILADVTMVTKACNLPNAMKLN